MSASEGHHTTWGVVATIKADRRDILNFVAHHLEIGADHIWIYLDAPNPEAKAALKAHPKVTPVSTGEGYWDKARGKRPKKHQNRQSYNARHAYGRAQNVDWLLHIDVDEFLWPNQPVGSQLADLAPDCLVARVRPAEALSSDGIPDAKDGEYWFKKFISDKARRTSLVDEIYPTFAPYVKGGFLSHVAGKIFIRTGQPDMQIKIHNVLQNGVQNPGQVELSGMQLLHLHATSWDHWMQTFAYRHQKGSYRDEMAAARPKDETSLNLHQLFAHLAEEPDGLRKFYEEVCLATPDLREKLAKHDLVFTHQFEFAQTIEKHFPKN